MTAGSTDTPRVTVIVPCFRDGRFLSELLSSLEDQEPVELVVVDDASDDEQTAAVLADLGRRGVEVVRHERNRGVGAARTTGLGHTTARFVLGLDADDVLVAGTIGRLADLLEEDEQAVVAYGDYEEFGGVELLRPVPDRIDPYRIAYTNEYPPTAMFRRSFLERVGGWSDYRHEGTNYEDWDLWMTVAEHGERGVYAGADVVTYRQRVHGARLLEASRRHHVVLYRNLRASHPLLFEGLDEHRRSSTLGRARRALYPVVYGGRPRLAFEPKVKGALDRLGIWTLRR